jgi:hypothetical protein
VWSLEVGKCSGDKLIYFIDEDHAAYGAWIAELRLRGYSVRLISNADEAFRQLVEVESVEVVVIDIMLAVEDVRTTQFTVERTDDFLETGLRLLEDLTAANPLVFPRRAVLLTNTLNEATFSEARRISKKLEVPLWQKSAIFSPVEFGDRVERFLGRDPQVG